MVCSESTTKGETTGKHAVLAWLGVGAVRCANPSPLLPAYTRKNRRHNSVLKNKTRTTMTSLPSSSQQEGAAQHKNHFSSRLSLTSINDDLPAPGGPAIPSLMPSLGESLVSTQLWPTEDPLPRRDADAPSAATAAAFAAPLSPPSGMSGLELSPPPPPPPPPPSPPLLLLLLLLLVMSTRGGPGGRGIFEDS